MKDSQYNEIVEALFNAIEDEVDEIEADIDIDSSAGMLVFEFPDRSSVVLSRQVANHEVWVAAKSGGYHLAYIENRWICGTTEEEIGDLLDRVFTEQLNQSVTVFSRI